MSENRNRELPSLVSGHLWPESPGGPPLFGESLLLEAPLQTRSTGASKCGIKKADTVENQQDIPLFNAQDSLELVPPSLGTRLEALLMQYFGYKSFRPGQLDVLKSVLAGRDTMAVMPTGSGKSLCYQIPALFREGLVVVVSPLIALMRDQVQALKSRGIAAGCLHSGQEIEEKHEIFGDIKRSKSYLLYLSPERVQKPGFATWIQNQKVSLIAIDEAHCVSQWGPEFRRDYHRLDLLRKLKPDVPILALTATATPQVLRDVRDQLKLKEPAQHIYGFYRPNLFYQVQACATDDDKLAWVRQALDQTPEGRILIYCGTRKQCEEVKKILAKDFKGVEYYHAGLDSEKRGEVEQNYHSGITRVLACTNAFGMGIDHPNVRLVIHYQMPANVESFYQEMGRAGRDGNPSTCLLLYSKKDRGLHAYFITQSDAPETNIKSRWRALDTMVQFSEGAECRHSGILTYFRDTQRIKFCGHCDICAATSPRRVLKPQITLPKSTVLKKKSSRVKKGLGDSASSTEAPLSPQEQMRFDHLRDWRLKYAEERDLPAFVVFSNKTLRELAQKVPQSTDELANIYGFGEHKIEHLGPMLLPELRSLSK